MFTIGELRDYLDREAWHALWLALAREEQIPVSLREEIVAHPTIPDWLRQYLKIDTSHKSPSK
jgi:hypothetical protein